MCGFRWDLFRSVVCHIIDSQDMETGKTLNKDSTILVHRIQKHLKYTKGDNFRCCASSIRFSHKRPKWLKGKWLRTKCLFRERYPQIYDGNYIFRLNSHATNPMIYSKTYDGHSQKDPKIGFRDQLSLNAGQKYCRMLQGEHSAKLSTFIKPPFVISIFCFCLFLSGHFT